MRADAAGDIISLPVGSQVVGRKPGVRCALCIRITICDRHFQAAGPPKRRLGQVTRPVLVRCLAPLPCALTLILTCCALRGCCRSSLRRNLPDACRRWRSSRHPYLRRIHLYQLPGPTPNVLEVTIPSNFFGLSHFYFCLTLPNFA